MCIAQWKASHTGGNLNDRKTLREALAYWNYSNSPAPVQDEIAAIVQNRECDQLLGKPVFLDPTQYCLGDKFHCAEQIVYFTIDTNRFFSNPATRTKQAPEFLADVFGEMKRLVLFVSDWDNDDGNPAFPAPEQVDCAELLKALGMCGKEWKKDDAVTILALKVKQSVHKPTWLDSGLVFFWCAAPQRPKWGLTRSLETGRLALREWVLFNQAGAFDVVDYWNRHMVSDCDLREGKLGSDYWVARAKEIRS